MHPAEFKAWFDGFTENIKEQPTKAQWARIRKRVAEVDGHFTPRAVFVERYYPWVSSYPVYTALNTTGVGVGTSNDTSFTTTASFNMVGQAEAISLSETA